MGTWTPKGKVDTPRSGRGSPRPLSPASGRWAAALGWVEPSLFPPASLSTALSPNAAPFRFYCAFDSGGELAAWARGVPVTVKFLTTVRPSWPNCWSPPCRSDDPGTWPELRAARTWLSAPLPRQLPTEEGVPHSALGALWPGCLSAAGTVASPPEQGHTWAVSLVSFQTRAHHLSQGQDSPSVHTHARLLLSRRSRHGLWRSPVHAPAAAKRSPPEPSFL